MAKATHGWKGGKDIRALGRKFEERGQTLKSQAVQALEKTVEEGADMTQDLLEDAVTRTGLARQARGGFPGRHRTGNMVGSVSFEVNDKRSKIVMGRFGWWGANFERYFREQDDPGFGPGNIPPARALPRAYVAAREKLRERLDAIVRGRSNGDR